jgi:ATP phosphoribosyltransferase
VITVAIPTGVLLPGALELLGAAGLAELSQADIGRRLVLEPTPDLRLITVRPLDVAAYVDHGSADLGICGKDSLWETERVHYELLDLGFGGCRLVMAVPEDSPVRGRETWPPLLRVATKYVARAARYLASVGQEAELIKLYGSVELAPLAGLADAVIDLTATGTTLRANRLRVVAEVDASTARLIANQVSLRTRGAEVQEVVARLRGATARGSGAASAELSLPAAATGSSPDPRLGAASRVVGG